MAAKHKPATGWRIAAVAVPSLLVAGCATPLVRGPPFEPSVPPEHLGRPRRLIVEATAYCPCGRCCNWRRSWFGLGPPVIASGPSKGRPKAVGITATGTPARPGTVAADPAVLPFGTILRVPGYGWGRVEDTGSAIRGYAIDLFHYSHDDALRWGRRRVVVDVWPPSERR
ncbi:MAG: 3D domain-containing protein [Kiritimatiellae bacterium]|nr:3D domain-containing protein [Kiritimatiellia bacterium]